MEIIVNKTVDWDWVYKVALYTQGKTPKKQFPSSEWKTRLIKSEHSPLRELKFIVEIKNVPNFTINHLVRHIHAQPYVSTMREDLTGISSGEITRLTPNSFMWSLNAQEVLNVSKVRLCNKSSLETRDIIKQMIFKIGEIERELYSFCVPSCIAYCGCPEFKNCGVFNKFLKENIDLEDDIFDLEKRKVRYRQWINENNK